MAPSTAFSNDAVRKCTSDFTRVIAAHPKNFSGPCVKVIKDVLLTSLQPADFQQRVKEDIILIMESFFTLADLILLIKKAREQATAYKNYLDATPSTPLPLVGFNAATGGGAGSRGARGRGRDRDRGDDREVLNSWEFSRGRGGAGRRDFHCFNCDDIDHGISECTKPCRIIKSQAGHQCEGGSLRSCLAARRLQKARTAIPDKHMAEIEARLATAAQLLADSITAKSEVNRTSLISPISADSADIVTIPLAHRSESETAKDFLASDKVTSRISRLL